MEVADHLSTDSRLIVPIGDCDQHGPHLPIGASTTIAEALAADLAADFGVLRAPAVPFGVNFPSDRTFPGRAGIREKTLHRALNDLLAWWEDAGFTEFVLITATTYDPHVENIASVTAAAARVRVVEALAVDLSEYLESPDVPEHGGELETSLLLHLRPESVRMELAEDFVGGEKPSPYGFRSGLSEIPVNSLGSVGRPTLASAAKGERIYACILQKIRNKVFIAPPDEE